MPKPRWPAILDRGAAIVLSYDTPVTLRQLFYRLVSEGLIRNTQNEYKTLSSVTAVARRDGAFPPLADFTREIQGGGPGTIPPRRWLAYNLSMADAFRRNRQDGQPERVVIALEKATLAAQVVAAMADYDVSVIPLRGFASHTFKETARELVRDDPRPTHLLYVGDHDPSGHDIQRDFVLRTEECWASVARVALTDRQVTQYNLPPMPGKATDSRARAFIERYGELVQVEVEALDPAVLLGLVRDAHAAHFDPEIHAAVLAQETEDRARLADWEATLRSALADLP